MPQSEGRRCCIVCRIAKFQTAHAAAVLDTDGGNNLYLQSSTDLSSDFYLSSKRRVSSGCLAVER